MHGKYVHVLFKTLKRHVKYKRYFGLAQLFSMETTVDIKRKICQKDIYMKIKIIFGRT